MRLKSIYVEGFKSYATPTYIGEFDPSFNASKFFHVWTLAHELNGPFFVVSSRARDSIYRGAL